MTRRLFWVAVAALTLAVGLVALHDTHAQMRGEVSLADRWRCLRNGHLWDSDRPSGPIHERDICWRCDAVREAPKAPEGEPEGLITGGWLTNLLDLGWYYSPPDFTSLNGDVAT